MLASQAINPAVLPEDARLDKGFRVEAFYLLEGARGLPDVDFSAAPDRMATLAELDPGSLATLFWDQSDEGATSGVDHSGASHSGRPLALRVEADLVVETPGSYTFHATSAGETRIGVDGQEGLQTGASGTETAITLDLGSGVHKLVLRHAGQGEVLSLGLDWQGPDSGDLRTTLTSDHLVPAGADCAEAGVPGTTALAALDTNARPVIENTASSLFSPAATSGEIHVASSEGAVPADSQVLDLSGIELLPGVGNENPTVSFGLTRIADWSTAMPFLDMAKMMRPWIGHEPNKWGGMTFDELKKGGYLDKNGWPVGIPEGLDSIGTIWDWEGTYGVESRAGTYVLQYDGDGELQIGGKISILSQENGRITFENPDGRSMWLKIRETDPDGTGDYIRNISVVKKEYLDLYEAGAMFNPGWLDQVSDAREFRFMDWMRTNFSPVVSWDDHPATDDAMWSSDMGAPVEVMVRLANEAGIDPWFNMPHQANDDFIRLFAEYVRDNLDPDLTVRVEYSNETWNWSFDQPNWLREQAEAEWGDTSATAHYDYHSMRATQIGLLWKDVFSQTLDHPTLVNVMGTHTRNDWGAERILSGTGWQFHDPDGFVEPASVFDEMGVTTYFGGWILRDKETRLELINAIEDPAIDAAAWLTNSLLDTELRGAIPDIERQLLEMRAVADQFGLKLVAYEGGEHVHHSFATTLTAEENEAILNFMIDYVRSEDMAMLYEELWSVWVQMSDGAFMHYGDVSAPDKWGSTGIIADLNDTNPRAEFLFDKMKNATPWWDAEANPAYLQGVTEIGTDGADTMVGTDQEDFLAGGGGNDAFVVGAGNDGINGGDGTDRLVLTGTPEDYRIYLSGDGYRFSGPEGDKFVINVETFQFGDGQVLSLEDLVGPVSDEIPKGAVGLDLTGHFHDPPAATKAVVTPLAAADTGVQVMAVNQWSELGRELGLDSDTPESAYVVVENGRVVDITHPDGQVETIAAEYRSLQDNLAGPGAAVDGTALEAALLFGDVIAGARAVYATNGDDQFQGWDADDEFHGLGGNDRLSGGNGNDVLVGGKGRDVLTGGAGLDRFVFRAGDGGDRITDFTVEDQLILNDFLDPGVSLSDAASLDAGGDLVISNGVDQITFEGLDLGDLGWIEGA